MLIGIPALLGPEFLIKATYAVVATSEPRLYGNVVIRKDVIYPQEAA